MTVSHHIFVDPLPPSPFSALVVDPNEADKALISSTLASAGFIVTSTDNFPEAKSLLITHPPLVLVTEIRLGDYNGLQLVLRAQSVRSMMTVVVASSWSDPVLHREAERAGATVVLKPLMAGEFLAAVYRTAMRRPDPSGAVEPIRTPFERRQRERRRAPASSRDAERRHSDRRRDISSVLLHAASLA